MTAKQLFEMTQLWYKTHEQWKWTSDQLTKKTKQIEELEGWRTALQLDNLQLRRQLGYDEVDYKGPPTQTMTRRDGGTPTDGGVGCDPGISNRFKVRLPRPLTLPEGPWALSLWSLSVPDETVEQTLGQGTDTVCQVSYVLPRLSNVQGGKYTEIRGEDTWINNIITLTDAFAVRPKTGVEFWTRVHQRIQELRTHMLQTEFEKDASKRVQQPQAWMPTFRWEGDVWILQANKRIPYDPKAQGLPFAISLKIAQAFGFVKQDPKTQAWSLGPNLVPSYPVYDQMPLATANFTTYAPEGPTLFLPSKWNQRYNREWEWFRIYYRDPKDTFFDRVVLSNGLEWRFIHLNRSYARLTNQLETVMVYTDAVQSNTINHRQVPLLRSLHLHRSGRGRVTVEPMHREWVALNGQTLELLEFQLATPSGPLTDLSPGQTIVTLGLKPIKS